MPETFLNIADIAIRIDSSEPPGEEPASRFRYDNFVLKKRPDKIDIGLDLKVIPGYATFDRTELFRTERDNPGSGLDWRISRTGKKILIEGGTSGKYQLIINENLNKGEAFIINADGGWKLTDVIYGFLQVLTIYYLAKRRLGILFHSAGLCEGQNGYLFAGLSRAGKSTTSRIWDKIPEVDILNDDRIIVRNHNGALYMHSTPWHGDYSEYMNGGVIAKARLSKLFYIYHRKTNFAQKMDRLEAFSHLFKTLFISFWDKACVKFTADFLADILRKQPCYKFGFKNDSRIVSYIRNLR